MIGKTFRFLLYGTASLVLLLCILAQIPSVQEKGTRLLETQIAKATGYQVAIEGLSFTPPFTVSAKQISLSNQREKSCEIKNISLSMSPSRLLAKTIALSHVQAQSVEILSLSSPKEKEKKQVAEKTQQEKTPYFCLEIDFFSIEQLTLPIKNKAHSFQLDGSYREGKCSASLWKNSTIKAQLTFFPDTKQIESHVHYTAPQGTGNLSFAGTLKNSKTSLFKGHFYSHYSLTSQCSPYEKGKVEGTISIATDGSLAVHNLLGHTGPITISGDLLIDHLGNLEGSELLCTSTEMKLGQMPPLPTSYASHPPGIHIRQKSSPLTPKGAVTLERPLLKASLSGPYFHPTIESSLSCEKLDWEGHALSDLKSAVKTEITDAGIDSSFSLQFSRCGTEITGSGACLWSTDSLEITRFTLEKGTDHLEAQGIAYWDDKTVKGTIDLAVEDIRHYTNGYCGGQLALKASLDSSSEAKIQFHSPLLTVNSRRYEEVTLQGDVEKLDQNPNGLIKLSVKTLEWGGNSLHNLLFETRIDPALSLWPYTLGAKGESEKELSLFSQGAWHWNQGEGEFSFSSLELLLKQGRLRLNEPFSCSLKKGILHLSPLFLSMNEGSLYTTFDYGEEYVHTSARIDSVPFSLLGLFVDTPDLEGTLSADLFLFGSPKNPKGHFTISLDEFRSSHRDFATVPSLQAALSANVEEGLFDCKGTIGGMGKKPIEFTAVLPVTCSLAPLRFRLDKHRSLQGALELSSDIAPLLQTFVTDTNRIGGELSLTATLSGSLKKPAIDGTITLEQGSFESLETGAIYEKISATLQGDEKKLLLKEFAATSGTAGTITGAGEVSLDPHKNFPFDIALEFSEVTLIQTDTTSSTVTGTLNLQGDTKGALLSGNVVTDAIYTTVPSTKEALPDSFEITYVNQPEEEVPPTIGDIGQSSWPIQLAVDVQIPGNAYLVAPHLNSEWKGDILLEGTTRHPLIHGKISITKGEYVFNGKAFTAVEGNMQFAGDLAKKTTLFVVATRDFNAAKIDAILKGPIHNPRLSFSSTPSLSQREILSWILFNRGLGDTTAFEARQLNQSAEILNQIDDDSPNVLAKLQEHLGIDSFDITHNEGVEGDELSVQVGKYLTPKVFVSLSKSITEESDDKISIEANIVQNFKVEANVNEEKDTQLFLKWRKDY